MPGLEPKDKDYAEVQKYYGVLSFFSFLITFALSTAFGIWEGKWGVFYVSFAFSCLLLLTWYGMKKRKRWGKFLAIFLAILIFPVGFPVSSIFSGYIVYRMYRKRPLAQ